MTNNPEVNLIYSKGKSIQNLERLTPVFSCAGRTMSLANVISLVPCRQKSSLLRKLWGSDGEKEEEGHNSPPPRSITAAVCFVSSCRARTTALSLP